MRTIVMMLCLSLGWTADAFPQVFTPVRPPIAPETPESKRVANDLETLRAEVELERAQRNKDPQAEKLANEKLERMRQEQAVSTADNGPTGSVLTQAALQGIVNENNPELSIQAAELYFNRTFRVYLRSTLTMDEGDEDEEEAADGEADDGDAGSALEDRIKSALLDPYGGLLYLTTGAFHPVLSGTVAEGERPRGLFLDARTGVRAVQVEDKASENNAIVPFATVSAGLVFQWPVWPKPTLSSDADSVGDFVFGLTWVSNAVLDKSASTMFSGDDAVLDRWTHTFALTAGISLKGLAKLTFTGNPWSSNDALGKRFSVGLAIVRDE